jgi:hypothetical protein
VGCPLCARGVLFPFNSIVSGLIWNADTICPQAAGQPLAKMQVVNNNNIAPEETKVPRRTNKAHRYVSVNQRLQVVYLHFVKLRPCKRPSFFTNHSNIMMRNLIVVNATGTAINNIRVNGFDGLGHAIFYNCGSLGTGTTTVVDYYSTIPADNDTFTSITFEQGGTPYTYDNTQRPGNTARPAAYWSQDHVSQNTVIVLMESGGHLGGARTSSPKVEVWTKHAPRKPRETDHATERNDPNGV